MQRIVIQGVEGSYSHAAALWYFGERITVVSSATFAGAFNAVAEGLVDAAMVPIGNSYAGPVREVCHLLKDSNLVVTGACQRLIRHCLMALPGQTLEHITRVRSHPQALMQCDVFLSRLGVEIVEAPDTAGSAKLIREQALYGVAAIASAHAARIYQLDILAEDIQVREDNTTCFVVLRKAEARLACLDAKKRGGCAMPANRPQVDLPAQRAAHAGARIQKGRVLFPGASTVHLDPGTTPGAPLERTSSPLAGFAPGCGRCGPGLARQAAFRRAEVSDRTPHGDPAAQIPGGKGPGGTVHTPALTSKTRPTTRDFWLFLGGETISSLGSSFTLFALPLLVYRLTGSALNLGLSTAAETLPYLCFGLLIGAWVDRVNRKRLMIAVDLLQALTLASIPTLYALGHLSIGWIYGVGFASATLKIGFEASQFAALPSLIEGDELIRANGRLQASFSLAQMVGPLLAGALLFILPLPALLSLDAGSFLASACMLSLIRRSFHARGPRAKTGVRQDIAEGLGYVLRHPVLRAISFMTPLMNFLSTTTTAQLVLLAAVTYRAGSTEIGLLYAAGSLGIVLFSLLAGPLRRRWPFSRVAIGSLLLMGGMLFTLGVLPWYWGAVVAWGLSQGAGMLFNLNTRSLRQLLVPDHLLGRVVSVSLVLAYSSVPLGALVGGLVLQQTGVAHVAQEYAAIGLLIVLVALAFSLTALGRAERYLPGLMATPQPHAPGSRPAFRAFFAGMRAMAPLTLVNILPLVVYGVTALRAGLSPLEAQALAISVFSGAILPAVQALRTGTPPVAVFLLIVLLNARHLLYSAKLGPHLRRLPLPQRLLASYVLADETAGALEQRERVGHAEDHRWPFLMGAGLTLWLVVQSAVALGLVLAGRLPVWEGMSLLPTLAFLGLTVLNLKGRASVVAAATAGVASLALSGLPLGLGLLAAAGLGLGAARVARRWHTRPQSGWVKEKA